MKPSATSLLTNRPATIDDLSVISTIIFACSTRLKSQNHPDWSRYYTIDRLTEKLTSQLAYLFFLEAVPVGVVFLSTDNLYYYSPVDLAKFSSPDSPAIYISTLAISPEYQHRGFATQLINFCEKFAIQNKIVFLRLDCNGQDEPLVGFYKKRGFKTISPMEKEPEYLLMEKSL